MAKIHETILDISRERGGLVATQKQGAGISFAYRGIDDVVTHLKTALDNAGVLYWPSRIISKEVNVRELTNAKGEPTGKAITTTSLEVEYTFLSTEDDSTLVAQVPGFAQDFADRNDAQAMSVALRTALIQIFKLQAGDKDPEITGEDTNREVEKAVAGTKTTGATVKKRTAATARDELQAIITDKEKPYDGEAINALGNHHSGGKEPGVWMSDLKVLEAVLDSVSKGEVA